MGLVEYFEAERLLKRYGIRSIGSSYVDSAEEAADFAGGNGIVLKAISENALHKSKEGLVKTALVSEREIQNAYSELARKAARHKPYKMLAQKMVKGGIEIIMGEKTDIQFGKLVLLGLGGIYVEAFRDFALGICPISNDEAMDMIAQLRSKSIIAGDDTQRNLIANLLVKVSRMYSDSRIKELDLNPIILHDGTYDAVDLRMIR